MTTILIVEDDPAIRMLLTELLADEGYTTSAVNGRMALLALSIVTPDLIITDIMMPEMNGLELCTHIKAHPTTATIPIIVCSAGQNKPMTATCPCDAFMEKPFTMMTVLNTVTRVLTEHS